MRFLSVTGKMGNMRKAVEWTVCPRSEKTDRDVTIQSDNRIAKVNLDTGKAILSNGKGGHQGFHKLLAMCGAIEVDCPADMMAQLKAFDAKQELPAGPVVIMG